MDSAAFDLKKQARRVFDSIIVDEPNHFYSNYGSALTNCKEEKYEESLEYLTKTIKVEPADSNYQTKETKIKLESLIVIKNVKKIGKVFVRELPITGSKIGETLQLTESSSTKVRNCKVCDKNFTKTFSLNRHMLLHTGEKPHKCEYCRKAFIQKTDMERHQTTHSDILNFECTICQKRFKTKKNLNSHKITHSDVRPFKCQFCEKSFKVKRLLIFHEGLHKDVKPFNCDICGKGFPAKPYIKSHLKTHMNEKPFSCNICNFPFKRNYDLHFHIRNQHKDYVQMLNSNQQN